MKGGRSALVAGCLVMLGGCTASHTQLHRALLADRHPPAHAHDLEAHYVVRCPDVLEVHLHGPLDRHGRYTVGANGCIALGPGLAFRVAGQPATVIAGQLARHFHVAPEQVEVHVAEHNSQYLYLVSEVEAEHQVLPYRGPETILDLLQRTGLARGAALGDIRVVRGHVADGKPPEVFEVDLQAILLRHDLQSNISLQPGDHIHVGQGRPSRLACCIPPWLRPLYGKLWDVK